MPLRRLHSSEQRVSEAVPGSQPRQDQSFSGRVLGRAEEVEGHPTRHTLRLLRLWMPVRRMQSSEYHLCSATTANALSAVDRPVGARNSAVVVDLARCGPTLSPRVPNLVPIPGPRMERETPGQRPRPNYGHPQASTDSLSRRMTGSWSEGRARDLSRMLLRSRAAVTSACRLV